MKCQVLTLISDKLQEDEIVGVAGAMLAKGLIADVRLSVAGVEVVLNPTPDFTNDEYTAYVKQVLDVLGDHEIGTIENQVKE